MNQKLKGFAILCLLALANTAFLAFSVSLADYLILGFLGVAPAIGLFIPVFGLLPFIEVAIVSAVAARSQRDILGTGFFAWLKAFAVFAFLPVIIAGFVFVWFGLENKATMAGIVEEREANVIRGQQADAAAMALAGTYPADFTGKTPVVALPLGVPRLERNGANFESSSERRSDDGNLSFLTFDITPDASSQKATIAVTSATPRCSAGCPDDSTAVCATLAEFCPPDRKLVSYSDDYAAIQGRVNDSEQTLIVDRKRRSVAGTVAGWNSWRSQFDGSYFYFEVHNDSSGEVSLVRKSLVLGTTEVIVTLSGGRRHYQWAVAGGILAYIQSATLFETAQYELHLIDVK
jgi:hypothetical protein